MEESERAKGRIVINYQIFCGKCANWLDLEAMTRRNANKEARQRGFVLSKDRGWLCKACVHATKCSVCKSGVFCSTYWQLDHYRG